MKKVAFICVHNSCRSQIAEGLCKSLRPDLVCYSAGTETKPQINQDAVRIMESNYNIVGEANIRKYAQDTYQEYSGLAIQYMFNSNRNS